MHIFRYSAAAAFVVAMTSSAAWANCNTRHFYNHSNVAFTVVFNTNVFGKGGGTCSIGTYTGRQCSIPPGRTADLHYPEYPQLGANTITISSRIYPATSFDIGLEKCYLGHRQDTGNIVVNDPASGDIQTCGRFGYPQGYSCQ